ncbi:MAG TPA: thioredoxin domain-containing protein, partial [Pyrinomonadaceae bacterium]
GSDHRVEQELLDAAYAGMVKSYDSINGGFGGAPKFPPAMALEFLLRTYVRTGNEDALDMVQHTTEKMARGGIYDQLGGGFHRYSTDSKWLVPHFEKMLYDNALLSRVYLHYFQVSQSELARETAEGILDYVLREMTDSAGGFYSTQDADSEGHEGKFFVWDFDEIKSVLGEADAASFIAHYNVTKAGNFEGKNILNVNPAVAPPNAESRRKLFEVREQRIKPDRDEKIITAWNGLMLASFAEAGVILDRADYTDAARKNAEFVLSDLRRDGFLLRTYKDGVAKFNAYLEDYAFFIEGLVTLYETTGEFRWLKEAIALTDRMIEEFWDEEGAGFFFTGKSHENLIVRSKDYFDNAIPSGNSVAASVLLRLAILTDTNRYRELAQAVFGEMADSARRYPSGFGYALAAIDFLLSSPKEIAIVGKDADDIKPLLREAWRKYLPNKVVAPGFIDDAEAPAIPLLQDRPLLAGRATAYVCQHYTCKQPVNKVQALAAELD